MRSLLFVLMCLIFTAQYVWASDIKYYYNYKDKLGSTHQNYEKMSTYCATQDQTACDNKETLARSLILQRITAYQEFYTDLMDNYNAVFPGVLRSYKPDLDKHFSSIQEAKHYTSLIEAKNLPELEKTVMALLSQNKELLDLLSAGFHFNKVQNFYAQSLNTHKSLSEELVLAKEAGLETKVAKKHMDLAKADLDKATEIFEKSVEEGESENKEQNIKLVKERTAQLYKLLISANSNMLKAGEILQRFSDENYW